LKAKSQSETTKTLAAAMTDQKTTFCSLQKGCLGFSSNSLQSGCRFTCSRILDRANRLCLPLLRPSIVYRCEGFPLLTTDNEGKLSLPRIPNGQGSDHRTQAKSI
jgi:hypothetical protein